jgi:glycosyltransferase involved in cell wall biosynthesis
VNLLYAFPEPLPLPRARGIQVAHTVAELAQAGVDVTLYHVPGGGHPTRHYGVEPPSRLVLRPLSRSLPWPLGRVHSNRLFAARFAREAGARLQDGLVMVRHLKLAAHLLARFPQMRLLYEAHEVFADTAPAAKAPERQQEERLVITRAAAVVANSSATAARLTALYRPVRAVEVIPNGVDWPESLPEKAWGNPGQHIVYTGSLFAWKGVTDLVSAAADLAGCRIELVGGDDEQVIKARAGAPVHGAELVFTGQVTHAGVQQKLAQSCIAVLPNRAGSDSDFTSPIKLFEYMAAGCAIVASDLPAIHEILAPDEAVWSIPGDPVDLAKAIRTLLLNPAKGCEMGQRVREKARGFTWAARARRLMRVLDAI